MKTKTGTLYYMSPNVLNGEYSLATDVWSLGVILYIMMVGYPPFQGNDNEIITAVMSGKFDMESDDWDFVSPMVKDLISKMLVTEVSERITVDAILQHPWIVSRGGEKDIENDNSNSNATTPSTPGDESPVRRSSKDYKEHENRNGGNSNENVSQNQSNTDSSAKLWDILVGDGSNLDIHQMPAENAAICALLLQQQMQTAFNNLDTEGTGKVDPIKVLPELAKRKIKMNQTLWNNIDKISS